MRIVVRQKSGLGNQLSQYAAGRYYASRYGAALEVAVDSARYALSYGHPRPFLLSNFSIASPCRPVGSYDRLVLTDRENLRPVIDVLRRVSRTQVIRESVEQRYRFHPDLALGSDVRTVYLVGYWQAQGYAEKISSELREELRFREPARDKNKEILDRMEQAENSVSVHIRRGDYTLAAEGNIALPMSYYRQGFELFRQRYKDPTFFVFSDDMEFARQNVPQDARVVFVDHNDSYSAHEDLRLMSSCGDHILANSTFSWWGAWLNPRSNKIVFAPRYWLLKPDSYFPELFPEGWILSDPTQPRSSVAASP